MARDLLVIALIAAVIGCTIVIHGDLQILKLAIDNQECVVNNYIQHDHKHDHFYDRLDIHDPDNVVLNEKPKLPEE